MDTKVSKRSGLGREQVYNITGSSLRKFHASQARAAAGGLPCTIALLADSIGQSTVNAPFNINAWFARLQGLVERRAGAFSSFNTFLDVDSQDTRWSRTGTWGTLAGRGYVGAQAHSTTAAGATATMTGKGDRIVYRYLKTTDASTFTYSLDGAGAVTVDAVGAEAVGEVVLSAAAGVNHTLVITNGPGRHTQIDIEFRTGTTGGYRFIKAAKAGQKVGNFTDYGSTPGTPLELLKAKAVPDLTIVALETNDWGNGPTTVATYKAKMATIIQAAQISGNVLLVVTVPPKEPFISPVGTDIEPYNDALYELADEYDCALLDMQERWGTYTQAFALGLMATEAAPFYHPSDVGNQDYAYAVFQAVFQNWDALAAQGSIARQWIARQRFGSVAQSIELGLYEDGLFPARPFILVTAGGNMYSGVDAGKFWMHRADFMMQAGKKYKGENANLPAGDFDSFIRLKRYTTAARIAAGTAAAGAVCIDSDLNKIIQSDGTNWRDAMGTVV